MLSMTLGYSLTKLELNIRESDWGMSIFVLNNDCVSQLNLTTPTFTSLWMHILKEFHLNSSSCSWDVLQTETPLIWIKWRIKKNLAELIHSVIRLVRFFFIFMVSLTFSIVSAFMFRFIVYSKFQIITAAEQKTVGNIVIAAWAFLVWVGAAARVRGWLCTQMLLFTHASAAPTVKGENQEWEKEIKRKKIKRLNWVCWCEWAKPGSLTGRISCFHHKRWTLQRWHTINPGIRSVGQRSTGPHAPGQIFCSAYQKHEGMCHVDVVLKTEGLIFVCCSHACSVRL